jgi:hypothetical protein
MAVKSCFSGKSRGSLIPLSLSFFLISICLLFISINISSAYSAKKELTNIGEAAINKAAHAISIPAYYAQLNRFSSRKKVPLDCFAASNSFSDLIRQTSFYGKSIRIENFNCNLFDLEATISVNAKFPLDIPFFNLEQLRSLDIRTKIGASSVYIPN